MKVLDPQAALLANAEVYEFLKSSKTRPADKKIGAYSSVNLHNYNVVRSDVGTFMKGTSPHIITQPPLQTWAKDLVPKLKKYELTKTEVFSLINLGVGQNATSAAHHDNREGPEGGTNGGADEDAAEGSRDEEESPEDSGLDRMLFGLVVEEADDRFAGDDGEERITEILNILKEFSGSAVRDTRPKIVNGG